MKYYFSPTTLGLYREEMKPRYIAAESWPSDAIEVTQDIYDQYTNAAPTGKEIGVDNTQPCWVDIQTLPLNPDQLAAKARAHRDDFIIATDPMMVSDYSIDDAPLTKEQRTELTATRALYRAWPMQENWPLIELPELPQWLLVEAVNQGYRVPVWPPLSA
ncbi:putative tail fiber assembly protein [Yersinia bercovieri]|uniref:tail fiber assembly protein n=1 Tax=Yersinia TaxID=629 RepID=UPI00061C794B|nr:MULTISPECIES: tail fiber assembly protein [Yersinia]QDW31975.1 phage tail protein [Yersinia sp. KBS0713]CNE48691.1 putative tail fiber assembly protein [Yersinia bercovieri]